MSEASPLMFKSHRWLIVLLITLAAAHISLCMFLSNRSWIDLDLYAAGKVNKPFQYRVGMMPVVQWSKQSSKLQHAAASLERVHGEYLFGQNDEPITAEKLGCTMVGVCCVMLLSWLLLFYGWHRLPALWWLPAVLLLVILATSYTIRAEADYWYPWDAPHLLLFGIATLALLEGWWAVFAVAFLIDIPVRETGVFLLLPFAALIFQRKKLALGLLLGTPLLALWAGFRAWVTLRYRNNVNGITFPRQQWAHLLTNPEHWPQFASALGYLVLPLFLGWRLLAPEKRWLLWSMVPALLVASIFGIPWESRIYMEWSTLTALLLCEQLQQRLWGERQAARQ